MATPSLRGVSVAAYSSTGVQSIAWPAGTVAGDWAMLAMQERESGSPNATPAGNGWVRLDSSTTTALWGKRVTADDLLTPVSVTGAYLQFMETFAGCGGAGNKAQKSGVSMSTLESGLYVFNRAETGGTLLPTAGKLHSDLANPKNRDRKSNTWYIAQTGFTGYRKLVGASGDYYTSVELLPAIMPDPPTLLSPENGAFLDPAVANTLTVKHNTRMGAAQIAISVRIRVLGNPTWSYLQSNNTIGAPYNFRSTANPYWTIAAAALTTGLTYEWSVKTGEDDGAGSVLWSDWSGSWQFTTAATPVVNSVTVSSPAEDLSPSVSWTETLGYGSQIAYEVRITPSAAANPYTPLHTTAVVAGGAQTTVIEALNTWTNGATYAAWVRIQQSGGTWSAWTRQSGSFTVSWTPPTAPSTVIPTTTEALPVVVVVSGVTGRDQVQLQASIDSIPSGWVDIGTQPPISGTAVFDNPLAEYGVALYYRARASDTVDGVEMWSAWTVSPGPIASVDLGCYLISPDYHTKLRVRLVDAGDPVEVQPINASYGLDADVASVDYGKAQGWAGTIVVGTATKDDAAAVLQFLVDFDEFWIRFPPDRDLNGALVDVPARFVARVNPRKPARAVKTNASEREFAIAWVDQTP